MSLAIGIDIAKQKIDIFYNNTYSQIPNEKKAIRKFFKSFDKDSRIVLESTGKYHRTTHTTLTSMGFSVMVVNPYQTKHFARALNLICKTDRVDAKMLALFAEKMHFNPTNPPDKEQQEMQDLSKHLDNLKRMKAKLLLQLRDSYGDIAKSIKQLIRSIDKEIEKVEEALRKLVTSSEEKQKNMKLLTSIPGIGETTAIALISYLKELGKVSKYEIAALAGVAPMNNESGSFRGKRFTKGGRSDVKRLMYVPILGAATQHNKRLKELYNKLVEAGKPKKVALLACMRKLIIWANTIIRNQTPWAENM